MFVKENDACDYLIILGAHVNGRVPSDSLERRIRKAEQYLKSHPMTKVIVSGGQGKGEDITEAEAMEKKAEAYAKYNKAAVAEMMIKVLPDVAAKIAEPLGQIDKITIIGGDGGSNGVDQVAGNVPAVMAKLFESMKEATGIDLADIVKADTYDAKVNRNVNVSGIDSVNLVVKDEKENPTA